VSKLDSKELLAGVEGGDNRAADEVFDRYVARLLALVRERIGPKLRRRIDADDIVQSTYRSFFVHAENGDFRLTESGDLWRLLASIALHKLYGQVEKHTAARRSIQREEAADELATGQAAGIEPTGGEVVAITEQLQLISKRLTPLQQAVLVAYMQGETVEAIAITLNKSPRTIRRLLAQTRREFEQELLVDAGAPAEVRARVNREPDARAPLLYSDYVLERLVGAGGMGKVYRAVHRTTGQRVAIKTLLKSRQRDRRVVEKFLQEAEILAQLHHPNIVAFHGVGRFPGGGYFIVMEFVDGTDLQTHITRQPLRIPEAIRIVRTVASAIAYAHSHGIVHSDLKPANVLLDSAQRVVVSDFGLAQFIDGSPNARPWLVGGTAGYIAPEVRANHGPPTLAVDIYGLGALFTTLITNADSDGDLLCIAAETRRKLSAACAKCLETNPLDRFGSVGEFIAEIEGC
jgi:eukaryotic-like serine/threonine-protein kinase